MAPYEPALDRVLVSFAASEGYLDEAEGSQQSRAHVVRQFGKQYLPSYEAGRKDCREFRGRVQKARA